MWTYFDFNVAMLENESFYLYYLTARNFLSLFQRSFFFFSMVCVMGLHMVENMNLRFMVKKVKFLLEVYITRNFLIRKFIFVLR